MKSYYPARPVGAEEAAWSDAYKNWHIEPKANGWRGWFDQELGIAYNRHGKTAHNYRLMVEKLSGAGIKSRFIDCEIMGMREKTGEGTLIVIDAFDPNNPKPYSQRVKEFEEIEPASFRLKKNALLRMPRLNHSKLKTIWQEMDFENRNGLVWEGFVMKQETPYEVLENPKHFSNTWHKWRLKW